LEAFCSLGAPCPGAGARARAWLAACGCPAPEGAANENAKRGQEGGTGSEQHAEKID